jgi:hypothetical protein
MKEQISNISKGLVSAVTLLKEGKTDEAVAALEKAAEDVVVAEAAATEVEKSIAEKDEAIAKSAETIAANETEIKKWSSLNVSTDTLPQLFEELGKVTSLMAGATEVLKSVGAKWRFVDGGLTELKTMLTALYVEK